MKHFIAIALFCLLSFSFLGEVGIFSFQEKTKIESTQDVDGEEDVNENGEKEKFAFLGSKTPNEDYKIVVETNFPLSTQITRISYVVEVRPPRA